MRCINCGVDLKQTARFCPICGTARTGAYRKKICGMCGNELQDGQDFCPKCGQRVGATIDSGVSSAINRFDAGIDKSNTDKKKKLIAIIVAAVAAIAVIVIGALVIPKLFVSVEDLCAQGNYEKAYEKADDDEKLEIRAENAAAVNSARSVEKLKNPDSFILRDVYYKEGENNDGETTKDLVLYISGENSYGASVTSYWLYTWDAENDKWDYYCSVSDLSAEEPSSYDNEEELIEAFTKAMGRYTIIETMTDGIELSKDAVKRINTMFKEDILDEVELLDVD